MKYFIIALMILASGIAMAEQDRYQFDNNEQAQRFTELTKELRCRYGYFVHYDPPVTPATLVLWVLPILIVVFGFGFIIFRQRKAAVKQTWSEQDEALLAKLIAKNERQEQI